MRGVHKGGLKTINCWDPRSHPQMGCSFATPSLFEKVVVRHQHSPCQLAGIPDRRHTSHAGARRVRTWRDWTTRRYAALRRDCNATVARS